MSLKEILAEADISVMIDGLIRSMKTPVGIYDAARELVAGCSVAEGIFGEHAVELAGMVIGWVRGGEGAAPLALLLGHLARQGVDGREADLKRANDYLENVLDNSPDAIGIADRLGKIIKWNRLAEKIYGYSFEELQGKAAVELYRHRSDYERLVEKLKSEGFVRNYEVLMKRQDGSVFYAGHSISLLKDAHGRTIGSVTVGRDLSEHKAMLSAIEESNEHLRKEIAERRQAEEALQAAKDAAEAANRTKSSFLANVSHELRTPLNAIIGYSELLMEDAPDLEPEEFIPDLQKIHAAGEVLLGLINDILDLSKIEAGKMDLYLETFDVARLIEDVAGTVRPMLDKTSNTLSVVCREGLGLMHADLTKVRQSLFNLLSNAGKFTGEGTIALEVSRETVEGVDWLNFSVSDTGIGMTSEQMARLFQAFSQADDSTTRRFGGTGLGLTITRHFCQMMQGDIEVKSRYGEGTTFTIHLPAHVSKIRSRLSYEAAEPKEQQTEEGRSTVLVIDDDPSVRDLLSRFLSKEGFRVQTAPGGAQGLELARKILPDAITLDVMMPGMDGWAVLAALKAESVLAGIPVIMLTMIDDKSMGYALGASDYMTKPVDRARLLSILEKHCLDADSPLHALVVEDDALTREMLRRLLEKEGWSVTEAENGRVALECMEEAKPTFILLDLMMPEMNGFEFVEELRRNDLWRSIPIVVATAKDLTAEDRLRLNGYVKAVLEKGAHSCETLLCEVRNLVAAGICVKS